VDHVPNIKSAKKRVLIIEKKTLRNQILKSSLRTTLKKFDSAVLSGDKEAVEEAYKLAVKKVDQAVAKGILHKNTAARKKSQLTLKLNKIGA
jgi:small subunit ribosomal protein S20